MILFSAGDQKYLPLASFPVENLVGCSKESVYQLYNVSKVIAFGNIEFIAECRNCVYGWAGLVGTEAVYSPPSPRLWIWEDVHGKLNHGRS